uniref:Transmembrane protein n=1 Tax=Ralstonia syzygii R24 TaxID=907261 RepID=G3ABJ6_9RALS|nr:hypothetical protein RALSY_mp30212 [Ralstonia syzygii R24]
MEGIPLRQRGGCCIQCAKLELWVYCFEDFLYILIAFIGFCYFFVGLMISLFCVNWRGE